MDTLARWRGVLAVLNQRTGDGRMIRSLRWPELPVPLRWAKEDTGAHDGAVLVGQIDSVEVVDDQVLGTGFVDTATDEGAELMSRMDVHGSLGVSLDLDDADFEVWTKADKREAESELWDTLWDDEATAEDVQAAVDNLNEVSGIGGEEVSEEGERYIVEARVESDEQLFVFTDALVRAATVVDIPAFHQAQISRDAADETNEDDAEVDTADDETRGWRSALVASAAPVAPPREWFDNPHFTELSPITVTDEGRVFGHAGQWGMCHTGSPLGVCLEIPFSDDNYARFRAAYVRCADGTDIATGPLTLGGSHAGRGLSIREAEEHYSRTSLAVADLVVGDDAFGPWVAGALRPGVSDEKVRELRGSVLSGDWREVWDGKAWRVVMIAVHAVNTAGSHVPRISGAQRNGRTYSLVASAGIVNTAEAARRELFTPEQVAALRAMADRQMTDAVEARRRTAAAIVAQVRREELARLVRLTAEKIGVA